MYDQKMSARRHTAQQREFECESILVIRLSSIGDILLTTPLLRALKTRFPSARIDFVVKRQFADLVRLNPHIAQVRTFDAAHGLAGLIRVKKEIKAAKYDVIFDIHKNFRSTFLRSCSGAGYIATYRKLRWPRFLLINFHCNIYPEIVPVYRRYLQAAAPFGVRDDEKGLEFHLDPEVVKNVTAQLSQLGLNSGEIVIGIAPGAGFATKRWLPERFGEVANLIYEQLTGNIILLGDGADIPIAREVVAAMRKDPINLVGKYSLMESAAALDRCDLLICNDTGLMHMASALNKKVVALFGPTTEELGFFPVGKNAAVVQVELGCRPCSHAGSGACPKKHYKCMRMIDSEVVLSEAKRLLARQQG